MSIGPLGMIASLAGSPLAQSQGSEVNRTQQETSSQLRQTQMLDKAESASGVGQTEQDEGATDRDADGRRLWEHRPSPSEEPAAEHDQAAEDAIRQSKDPSGMTGRQLDLQG